jgi:Bifunctional DNA primase/polymerase, N-terminal
MNAVLRSALELRDRGISVLPVLSDKTPALDLLERTRGTRRWGSLRAEPAGSSEVEAWYRLDPAAGVAVICQGDLAVLDVDDPEHEDVPELPETPTVATPSDGHRHYWLKTEVPVRGRTLEFGELRAGGLYAVSPESTGYRWLVGLEEAERAELSDLLRNLARVSSRGELSTYPCSLGTSVFAWVNSGQAGSPEDAFRRVLEALSIPERPFGKAFPCPLHDDLHPSATLRLTENGDVLFHCFACHPGWLSLATVHALERGRRRRPGRVELALWQLSLLERAGLVEAVPLDAPPAPRGLQLLWDGVLRLFALRALTTEFGKPAPLARRFLAPWCGLGEHEVRIGLRELHRHGLIWPAGKDPRGLRLWWLSEEVRPLA